MEHQLALRRSQRLKEIAQRVGAVPKPIPPPLNPVRSPSLSIPDDERKADAILGQIKIEESATKSQPKGLKRFSSIARTQKSNEYSYEELYSALSRVIEDNGLAGVVEVLLRRFHGLEGDVNVARRPSTGVIKRMRNADNQGERGRLLQISTSVARHDIMQLLCPYTDQVALDESLGIALESQNILLVEILLGYGANAALFEQYFNSACVNGNIGLLRLFLRSKKAISDRCLTESLLPSVASGSLEAVLLLIQAGANTNHDNSSGLLHAIEIRRLDLVTAIAIARNPPTGESLNHALELLLSSSSSSLGDSYDFLEVILCAGPQGNAASEGLLKATLMANIELLRLLLQHNADINYDDAVAVGHAIQRNRSDIVGILLGNQVLKPEIASELITLIPRAASSADKVSILSKLLVNGASGKYCSELLILAIEQNDLDVAHLLISHGKQDNLEPVCSVDYSAAKSLHLAVSQQCLPMVKLLALEGKPSKQSLAHCFNSIPARLSRDNQFVLMQTLLAAGAEGPEVDSAFMTAVVEPQKSHKLIEFFIQHGAIVTDEILFATVTQASADTLGILLTASTVSPSTCSAAIPLATKLQSNAVRFRIIRLLLGPVTSTNLESSEVSKAVIEILQHCPEDVKLLSLLCYDGKADINAQEGLALELGAKISNPAVLDVLLQSHGHPLTPETIARALECASELPFSDPHRQHKMELLLRRPVPQHVLDNALIQEAKSAATLKPESNAIQMLVSSGADVNAKDGAPVCWAVSSPSIMDILLSRNPNPRSLSMAFPLAMTFPEPERLNLCEKLLLGGAGGEQISKAMCMLMKDGPTALPLIKVLLPHVDINFEDGKPLRFAVRYAFIEALDLLLLQRAVMHSPNTKIKAFQEAMKLKENPSQRCLIIQKLLKTGIPQALISDSSILAISPPDVRLLETLLQAGALVNWQNGEALDIATKAAAVDVMEPLLRQRPSESVLMRAYNSALALPKESRICALELIFKAGKSIDNEVARTLTLATKQPLSDREMIKLLLSQNVFDTGQSLVYAAISLDLETLDLLASSPKASAYMSYAFKEALAVDALWQSPTGLRVLELMLEKGASGAAVDKALYVAVEKVKPEHGDLSTQFVEILIKHHADVNYERGLSLQKAALGLQVPLIRKLLPRATAESRAMAIPYLFLSSNDKDSLLVALNAFNDSPPPGGESLDPTFKHPDTSLPPMLFMALEKFPRDIQILKALLNTGYSPNQWELSAREAGTDLEPWPILCWALGQLQKKISSSTIEMLINEGANVNFKSKSGITPLMLAIQNQRPDIVDRLISKGANVMHTNSDDISPLTQASRIGNTAIMESLLQADADCDDGSLHDAARELRLDSMRLLIKYGHQVDYPGDRHEGRSALAELCLNAVDHDPTPAKLEDAIRCLVLANANIRLRRPSQKHSGKTIVHYALDSSDPMAILPTLLKTMWEYVNEDCFLYKDSTYTYSLTKYVEKNIDLGPRDQKNEILHLLRIKGVVDRFWANSIEATQPPDYCGAPDYIEDEVIRQKTRQKRKAEMHEDAMAMLELKHFTTMKEAEIMQIQSAAEMRISKEKAALELQQLTNRADTQLQLDLYGASERQLLISTEQLHELQHQKALADVQVRTQRTIRQETLDEERARHVMQIEYTEARIGKENEGTRQRLAIEGSARMDADKMMGRQHEREMARIKMQKGLVEKNMAFAGRLQGAGLNQRQIGYVTGEV